MKGEHSLYNTYSRHHILENGHFLKAFSFTQAQTSVMKKGLFVSSLSSARVFLHHKDTSVADSLVLKVPDGISLKSISIIILYPHFPEECARLYPYTQDQSPYT